MISFKCGHCGQGFKVGDEHAGKKTKCPKCRNIVVVPATSSGAAVKPVSAQQQQVIKFNCPHCNQRIGLASQYAGKMVRCVKCKNPMKVPSLPRPTAAAPKPMVTQPKPKDQTEVLRAGQEHKSAGPDQWNDMESLKLAEENAEAVDIPLKRSAVPGPDELAAYDRAMRGGDSYQDSIGSRGGQSRKGLFIGLGSTAAVLVALVMFALSAFSLFKGVTKGQIESPEAEEFVEGFVNLVAAKENEEVKSYFAQELQADINDSHIEQFAAVVAKSEIVQMECTQIRAVENEQGRKLFVWYTVYFMNPDEMERIEDYEKVESFLASVLEDDMGFKLESIATMDFINGGVSIGKENYDQLNEVFASAFSDTVESINWPVFGIAILIIFIVGIIQSVAVYTIFDKAGEPGWAIFVPVYNMWVWAVVGNRPGWVGLAACCTGFIPGPHVGDLVWFAIWIYITTGVAKAFGKGTGFGLGLCFLPIIFYPILAFDE